MAMRGFSIVLGLGLLGACTHFWHPPPDVPQPLPAHDWRREFAGTWRVVASRDSPPVPSAPLPELVAQEEAILYIADSAASPFRQTLLASILAAAGDTASGRLVEVTITRDHDRRTIEFWPDITDNYFGLTGVRVGDCFRGTWARESWGRILSAGHFAMCPMAAR